MICLRVLQALHERFRPAVWPRERAGGAPRLPPLSRQDAQSFSLAALAPICAITTYSASSALWISKPASCPSRIGARQFRNQCDAAFAMVAANLSCARLSFPGY